MMFARALRIPPKFCRRGPRWSIKGAKARLNTIVEPLADLYLDRGLLRMSCAFIERRCLSQ